MRSHASAITNLEGRDLKATLARRGRVNRIRSFCLVLPLLGFTSVVFIFPILLMGYRAIDDSVAVHAFPKTLAKLENWRPGNDIPESLYRTFAKELRGARKSGDDGRLATRLNYELPGARSATIRLSRALQRDLAEVQTYRALFQDVNKKWVQPDIWAALKSLNSPYTAYYFLAALDRERDIHGDIVLRPPTERTYVKLFVRTFWVSLLVAAICILLAYPIAYQLATLPAKTANLLLILVLLPFWTSLLVRTTAWIVLLQSEGVLNDLFVVTGLIDDASRIQMIYNMFGTIVAMTHILLPFMVLPLYSVMKTIPPSYLRAAVSLGATPARAWLSVYFPLTLPGMGAGSILVFILCIGYYVTPALVGGRTGQLIASSIAYHMQTSLNWGLAAAIGTIVLAVVLVMYWLYERLVGLNELRMG